MTQHDLIAGSFAGGCQCGAVRYTSAVRLNNAHICHCRMCQKAVGGVFAALVGLPDSHIQWTRGKPAVFKSSDQVERGFCANCGTPLYYRWAAGSHYSVSIATLDDPASAPPIAQYGNEALLPFFDGLHELPGRDTTTEGGMGADASAVKASNHQHPDHDTVAWVARKAER